MASALAALGNATEAVLIAKEAIKKYPEAKWAYRLLAAWSAMAGNLSDARVAAQKLLEFNPGFTIRRYLEIPGFQDMPEYRSRLVQGLREAGLPEE